MVFDPQTVDPTLIDLGVTTAADLNALLVQGGGELCGSLDLAGAAFVVEACTGVPAQRTSSLAVFPNPNNGDFRLQLPASGGARIELLDLSGRVVFSAGRAVAADGMVDLSLSGVVAAGTYVLRATVAEGRWEQRVVVQR
ncbi:MAG: T9SS type A sorting domain-containing protein, partial [Flavobacteriales bacterium]